MIQGKYSLYDAYIAPANDEEKQRREDACPPDDTYFCQMHTAPLPDGPTTTYRSDAPYVALSVARKAIYCGYAVCIASEQSVQVACEPWVIRLFCNIISEQQRATKVWQHYAGAPNTLRGWYWQMRKYVTTRWWDSDHPCAGHGWQGLNACNPMLSPLWEIAKAKRDFQAFDLTDALTYSVWFEYLNEYPERAELWAEFEAQHGAQAQLVACDVTPMVTA